MLVDSHCHIQDAEFDADRDEVLDRARAAGVSAFVAIGTDLDSSWRAVDLADSHPDVYAAVGVHPHEARHLDDRTLGALERLADSPTVVAIGEIGLDYHRMHSPAEAQVEAFHRQLDLARRLRRPVVIHSRDAHEETFDILAAHVEQARGWPADRPLGVMHCFAGDLPLALRYMQAGFMLSIPGTCTYPRADRVRAVAGGIPLRWMAVETDSPYLTPQSHRGRRNEPAYIVETVARIAELRGESPDTVAERTAVATAGLFGLGSISAPGADAGATMSSPGKQGAT